MARTPEGQAAAALPPPMPPMTADEAVAQAEAEGLTLLRSEGRAGKVCASGYHCVSEDLRRPKPYQAVVRRGAKNNQVYLGYCATAEEAALC